MASTYKAQEFAVPLAHPPRLPRRGALAVGARRGVPGVHGVDERDKLLDDGDEHAALLELDGIEVHLGLVARRSGVRGRVRRGRTREEIVVAARQLVDTADDLVDGEAQQRPPYLAPVGSFSGSSSFNVFKTPA